jgi:hypothetical protein
LVRDLATEVGVASSKLVAMLHDAIDRGIIPNGHIGYGQSGQMLYLTDAAWMSAQPYGSKSPASSQTAASKEASPDAGAKPDASKKYGPGVPEDVAELLDECQDSVDAIRTAALKVSDLEVRSTLESIAKKTDKILGYVARHPKTASKIKHASSYYLPTTVKLASSYAELERHSAGPEVTSTLAEVRDTLSMMDKSLSKLSDELVQGQSIDLKSDMKVMRTMLNQDGLSGEDDFSDGDDQGNK